MKKTAAFLLAGLLLAGCVGALASGGQAADPLVPLSYLNTTYLPDATRQASARIDTKTQLIYQSVLEELNTRHSVYLAQAGSGGGQRSLPAGGTAESAGFTDRRLKRGDVVSLPTGSAALLLAGSASVSYAAGGAAIDTTAGQVLPSGGSLPVLHRILAAENTTAAVTITSDTAVITTLGGYTLSPSSSVDYNALAAALAELGLFRGTGTAYGSGYDLEAVPTRIVGLVMFLRLIGAEQDALAYTGANPFADTPAWCDRYVAYAYAMGYAKGVGTGAGGKPLFSPNAAISAGEYMTFLLRALGYSDSGPQAEFTWAGALPFALSCGVVNRSEYQLLSEGTFLRAQVAYLSLYALSAPLADGSGTLADRLADRGTIDEAALYTTLNSVSMERLGNI